MFGSLTKNFYGGVCPKDYDRTSFRLVGEERLKMHSYRFVLKRVWRTEQDLSTSKIELTVCGRTRKRIMTTLFVYYSSQGEGSTSRLLARSFPLVTMWAMKGLISSVENSHNNMRTTTTLCDGKCCQER